MAYAKVNRDGKKEYDLKHIPGAVFDLDKNSKRYRFTTYASK